MAVLTSIVCSFGEGTSSADIKLELDDEMNKDSEGNAKSRFLPKEQVYILAQYDHSRIQVDRVASTDGGVQYIGPVNRNKKDKLLFVDTGKVNQPSLSYFYNTTVTPTWSGREGQGFTTDGEGNCQVSNNVPCYCEVSYGSPFEQYRLNTPDITLGKDDTYEVVVVFYISRKV